MEDILSMNLDDVSEVQHKRQQNQTNNRVVDPFNHYEVECNKQYTLHSCDEKKEATEFYEQVKATHRALIHVTGKARRVLQTDSPWFYRIWGDGELQVLQLQEETPTC